MTNEDFKKRIEKINKEDKFGNKLEVDEQFFIHLTLANGEHRNIGKIKISKDGEHLIYEKYMKWSNLYRKGNAWGFCYAVIEELEPADRIKVYCEDNATKYIITKEKMDNVGFIVFHQQRGFELQKFVELNQFVQKKIASKEVV